MQKLKITFLLALTGLLFAFGQNSASAQSLAEGRRQLEAENYKAARKTLNALMAKDAKDAKPYYYMGILLLQTSTLDSAEAMFNRGIGVNQREALNYIGLAKVQFQRNKPVDANANIEKALSFSKRKDANVLTEAGQTYLEAPGKHADQAITLLKEAEKLAPTNAEVPLLLGEAYFIKNVGGPAITSYERALQLNPKLAQAHMKMGKIWAQSRNYNEALKSLQKAVDIDTTFAPAYRELGELYYQASQLDNARKSYKTYVRLANNDIQARGRYAGFLYLSKDYPSAISYADEVLKSDPKNYIMLRVKGYSQLEAGDAQAAKATLDQYFATAPADKLLASDYENYGTIQSKLNMNKEALASYNKALEMDSTKATVHSSLAELHFKNKDYKKSAEHYQKRIKMGGGITLQDYFYLGQSLYEDKQYVRADSAFALITEKQPELYFGYQWRARNAARQDPESTKGLAKPYYEAMIEKAKADPAKNKKILSEGYEYLGYYYILKGDKANAKTNYQKVKELDPSNKNATEALKTL